VEPASVAAEGQVGTGRALKRASATTEPMTDAAVAITSRAGVGGPCGGEKSIRANEMGCLSMSEHLLSESHGYVPGLDTRVGVV
jgi:hypothetical protein